MMGQDKMVITIILMVSWSALFMFDLILLNILRQDMMILKLLVF